MTAWEKPDAARSALMRRVRQKKTAPEDRVAALLRAEGVAYRRNVRSLPGSPDFANKSRGWALFVNGCFWHRHTNCAKATLPKANRVFWEEKLAGNRLRDARKIRALRAAGYRVMVVWGCDLADETVLRARLRRLVRPGMRQIFSQSSTRTSR